MQQPKRRSKGGVILLAVLVAMLVMVAVPAVALAADTVVVNTGQAYATDVTFHVTATSATADRVSFEVRGRWGIGSAWSDWYPIGNTAYQFTNSITTTLTLPTWTGDANFNPGWIDGSQFQIIATFWQAANPLGTITTALSQVVELDFSAPPVSTLYFDPAGHPGRGDIRWTNGEGHHGDVWFAFGQEYPYASMGITNWTLTKNNNAEQVMDTLTWVPWGGITPPAPFVGISKPKYTGLPLTDPKPMDAFWNQNDGVYQVKHWARDVNGLTQIGYSYDTIGYDTKAPYVVWSWPATTNDSGYYTSNITVSGNIIDDGGSGVAGYFPWDDQPGAAFAPQAEVFWCAAETGGEWVPWEGYVGNKIVSLQQPLTVKVNAFDPYQWHISGSIYVYPNYNAKYAVFVTGSDYAGNGGFPYEDYGIAPSPAAGKTAPAGNYIGIGVPGTVVSTDVMAPSTVFTSDPAGAARVAPSAPAWTNKNITMNFVASDPGGSGIASGVAYTEYITGNSSTTPPALNATGTKGTSVVISETAPVGPVYVWYRSVDNAGNKEPWNVAWAWLDNKAPVLSITGNSAWYNGEFQVRLSATDNNSNLAAPGIEYQIPNWPMPFLIPLSGNKIPTTWASLSQNPGLVTIPVDPYPNSRTDGIWPLQFRATDQAGNAAESTTQTVKIDTRPPASTIDTFGADKWVNGTKPIVINAVDQNPGAGVAVTWYRTDQSTPWTANVPAAVAVNLATDVSFTAPVQGSIHTIDYFSIDNATNPKAIENKVKFPGNKEMGGEVGWAPIQMLPGVTIVSVAQYKTTTVKLDVTAPTVTAMDPKNGNWQKPIATVNFSGTDVGSGYATTEWSTDGGKTWTQGNQAQVGGDGVTTITYHGVDNVGITSANQTIDVKVASTPPTVTAQNTTVKYGNRSKNPTITFNVTAVTPQANVTIQIRTLDGRTISSHNYANVATGQDVSKTFTLNTALKPGKYNIRVSAQDQAGNTQTKRGAAKLTVTK